MSKFTPGPWPITWYECKADSEDVAHAKSEGRKIKVGHVLWRVPKSIGPIDIDHNHWAGWHLDVKEPDALLASLAPEMYAFIESLCAFNDKGANEHLKETGSYVAFDQPGIVQEARRILAKVNNS